jgi:hypothetical protein
MRWPTRSRSLKRRTRQSPTRIVEIEPALELPVACVAEMNADAEFDAALRRQTGVALDHAVLHFDGAAHRVDHAAELDEDAVPNALDDAP